MDISGQGENHCNYPEKWKTEPIQQTPFTYTVVATYKEEQPQVLVFSYQTSNMFWDESDYFAYPQGVIYTYKTTEMASFRPGDTVIFNTSQLAWDKQTLFKNQVCGQNMQRLFAIENVQPYHGNASISLINAAKTIIGVSFSTLGWVIPITFILICLAYMITLLPKRQKFVKKKSR